MAQVLVRFVYNNDVEKLNDKMGLIVSSLYPYPKTNSISVQKFSSENNELYCKQRALQLVQIDEKGGFYGLGAIKEDNVYQLNLTVNNSSNKANPYHADIILPEKNEMKKGKPLSQEVMQLLDRLALGISLFKDDCPQNLGRWCGEKIT